MNDGEESTRRRVLATGAAAVVAACRPSGRTDFAHLGAGIDDLVLTSSSGEQIQWRSLAGKPRALFFGFTQCPVICPVTIYELTAASDRIGAAAQDLRFDFVTIDPERDTQQRLSEYCSSFGPRVTGFTGTTEALARITRAFEVTTERVPLDNGSYTMNHTATVFLIDRTARVRDGIAFGSAEDVIETRLRALVS